MASQPKIILRPPPHREFLSGFAGIPACQPPLVPPPPTDPLVSLPILLRPQAHLSGTVDVRPAAKGTKAKWLRVELEKIEKVPNASGGKKHDATRFVELIGMGPGTLWTPATGLKSGEEVEEWADIPEGHYPFNIPIPEGLPPSTEIDSKGSGISYQLVATLCIRSKKGILKSTVKQTLLPVEAGLELHKLDILPTWPCFIPLLDTNIPDLPWKPMYGPTTGEIKESKAFVQRDGGVEGASGEVIIRAVRETGAVGPGDPVRIRVQIRWSGSRPIKLTRLDFVLRETITYRYPSDALPQSAPRPSPKVNSIFTANANVSPDPENPTAFAVLYENEPLFFNMTGVVPASHTRVTVRTAKHCDVSYFLKVRAMLEGGDEVAVDHWSMLVGRSGSREAAGLMQEIGWVEGLCQRPGAPATAASSSPPTQPKELALPSSRAANIVAPLSTPTLVSAMRKSPSVPRFPVQSSRDIDAPAPVRGVSSPTFGASASSPSPLSSFRPSTPPPPPATFNAPLSAEEEKARLYANAKLVAAQQQQFRIQNLAESDPPAATSSASFPRPVEGEKVRLFQEAQQTRDEVQGSVGRHTVHEPFRGETSSSPEPSLLPYQAEASPQQPGRISMSTAISSGSTAEEEKARLHQAAIIRRDELQSSVNSTPHRIVTAPEHPEASQNGYFGARPQRSETAALWASTPASSSPPLSASGLARSNTVLPSAESEKRRLFESAKAEAKRRQEEARIEFERQNALLAEMEADEEAQRRHDEEVAFQEQQQAAFREQERLRTEQEARIRAEFAREQAERVRLAELKRQREDELRREQERQVALEQQREEERLRGEERRKEEERRRDEEHRREAERRREEEARERNHREMLRHEEERREEEQRRAQELVSSYSQADNTYDPTPQVVAPNGHHSSAQPFTSNVQSSWATASNNHVERLGAPNASSPGQIDYTMQPASPLGVAAARPPERTASGMSFAPGTSVNHADTDFYAKAIGNASMSRASSSAARDAYLETIRQRSLYMQSPTPMTQDEHTAPPLPAPLASIPRPVVRTEQPQINTHHSQFQREPTSIQTTNHHPSAASAAPPTSAHPGASPFSTTSSEVPFSAAPPFTPIGHPQPQPMAAPQFKSAREEKEEEEARRRIQDAQSRANLAAAAREIGPSSQSPGEDDGLPSYQSNGAPKSLTASEEKQELNAYYAAKAEVDIRAGRAPMPPPSRQPTIHQPQQFYSSSQASFQPPVPAPMASSISEPPRGIPYGGGPSLEPIQEALYPAHEVAPTGPTNGYEHPALPLTIPSPPPATTRLYRRDSESESSAELHRDPQVAAGKQKARAPQSVEGDSQEMGELDRYHHQQPLRPPLPPQIPPMPSRHDSYILRPDFGGTFNLSDSLNFDFGSSSSHQQQQYLSHE